MKYSYDQPQRDSFQVLSALYKESDQAHREGSKGLYLLKLEKICSHTHSGSGGNSLIASPSGKYRSLGCVLSEACLAWCLS